MINQKMWSDAVTFDADTMDSVRMGSIEVDCLDIDYSWPYEMMMKTLIVAIVMNGVVWRPILNGMHNYFAVVDVEMPFSISLTYYLNGVDEHYDDSMSAMRLMKSTDATIVHVVDEN